MYSLRLMNGTKVSALYYKPTIGDSIRIDSTDKWYEVKEVKGRVAYCRETHQMFMRF